MKNVLNWLNTCSKISSIIKLRLSYFVSLLNIVLKKDNSSGVIQRDHPILLNLMKKMKNISILFNLLQISLLLSTDFHIIKIELKLLRLLVALKLSNTLHLRKKKLKQMMMRLKFKISAMISKNFHQKIKLNFMKLFLKKTILLIGISILLLLLLTFVLVTTESLRFLPSRLS